jgi:hypothetical protein
LAGSAQAMGGAASPPGPEYGTRLPGSAPLAHHGIEFVGNPHTIVQAIDRGRRPPLGVSVRATERGRHALAEAMTPVQSTVLGHRRSDTAFGKRAGNRDRAVLYAEHWRSMAIPADRVVLTAADGSRRHEGCYNATGRDRDRQATNHLGP